MRINYYSPTFFHLAAFPGFLRRQWWSDAKIRRYQELHLRRLLLHAYENVPYYARTWRESGVSPGDFDRLEDLARFPLVDGLSIRRLPTEEITSRIHDVSTCRACKTSGSSGVALRLYFQRNDHFLLIKASIARAMMNNGLTIRDRLARFDPEQGADQFSGWYEKLGLWRRCVLSTQASVESWVDALIRFKPTAIAGMSVTLLDIADELTRRGRQLPVQRVFCSGMRLEDHHRRSLQEFFNAPVYDMYGSYESGMAAWECRDCGEYHVNSDLSIVEVLKPDGTKAAPGETGEVVVTNLHSPVVPFIRYRQGDMAVVSKNKPRCGRNLPLIAAFYGRQNDRIVRDDLSRISQYAISTPVVHTPGVREWQFEQEESRACTLRLVVDSRDFDPHREILETTLRNQLGTLPFQMQILDRIERSPHTKWKSIVSRAGDRPSIGIADSDLELNA
jgi:phenylacetate-CoA ligase